MSAEVGLALGSNLGEKAFNIVEAVRRLRDADAVQELTLSSLYRTAPWGYVDQDWFVNACVVGRTALSPSALLDACKRIEREMGREATVRWGPRLIDIDVLYIEGVAMHTPQLTLPHAEMLNRAFVLVPLAELRPRLVVRGVAIESALGRLDTADMVSIERPDAPQP